MEGWIDERKEMRGGAKNRQLEPPGAFPRLSTSPLLYPSDNSLQKLGQENFLLFFFQIKAQRPCNSATDRTEFLSPGPCKAI